jgi:hypothetical protein
LVAAYREVYQPANGNSPSAYRRAKRLAKHPGISAQIEELQLERFPAAEDMRAVYEHGLAVIVGLSKSSEDGRVRLQAAQWLCAEAEKRAKLEGARLEKVRVGGEGKEEVIGELRELYRKALPEGEVELVEEVRGEEG